MSAGSNNIIIQVVDQVDPGIQAKIAGIGTAARQTAIDLGLLKTALGSVNTGTTGLGTALGKIPTVATAATGSTNRLTGAFAQLLTRVVGAEAGVGMLGGAFGRVGVAAGLAGPLIVAALAVGAIAGAILLYEKFEKAARDLVIAQEQLAEHAASQNDKLLTLGETLTRLTKGPLAAYKQELLDLPHRSIITDIDAIINVLQKQHSYWADLVSIIERYSGLVGALATGNIATSIVQPKFDLQDAEDFINDQKRLEAEASRAGKGLKGLQDALTATGAKLNELHNIEQLQSGRTLANTEVARKAIQELYAEELSDLDIYNAEVKAKRAGANGELLSEQRKAAADQLRLFNEELSKLKQVEGVTSPQDILALRQKQLSGAARPGVTGLAAQPALALNVPTLQKDIGNAQEAIDRQQRSLERLTLSYHDQNLASAAYSDQLKKEAASRKAVAEIERIRPGGDPATLAAIQAQINAGIESERVNKEQLDIYRQFQEPILTYNAALTASAQLVKEGAISSQQAAIADAQALRTKNDALNPLNEYNIALEHEVSLLGLYGKALTVATQVDQIRQQLQQKGYDLTQTQTDALSRYLTLIERQKDIQSDLNQLWEANAGTVEKLTNYQIALNTAVKNGTIGQTQFKIATAQTNIALADQAIQEDSNAKLSNILKGSLGKLLDGYKGIATGLKDVLGNALDTLASGVGDALGRAIAYAENLGDALKDVGRAIVSQVIGGLVKLGLQFLLTQLLGKTVAKATLADSIATAEAVSAAWAPAAAFSSLASFGANAGPAAIAVSTTVGLAEALAVVGSAFAQGGPVIGPGTSTSDSILAALSNGEFVVNARAAARNRPLLDSINSGTITTQAARERKLQVNVVHDGSTYVDVQQLDEYTVSIIARREARQAVQTQAPQVIASDLQNPNSKTSKAVNRNIAAPRKR